MVTRRLLIYFIRNNVKRNAVSRKATEDTESINLINGIKKGVLLYEIQSKIFYLN